jgi:hypothetical protein
LEEKLMKSVIFVLAAAVLCMSFAAQSQAAAITSLYNTGVNASGTPLSDGTIGDPHYTLVSTPSVAFQGGLALSGYVPWLSTSAIRVRTSAGGWPIPPYIGDDSLSAWIGPNNAPDLNGPVGYYTYQTTFSLSGYVLSTASITGGLWAADNEQIAIYLNNALVAGPNTVLAPDGYHEDFTSWSPFAITSSFQAGTNTLDFVVYNDHYNPPSYPGDNPTALRVEMTGTAESSIVTSVVPEPVSMIFFGTGLVAVGGYVARRRMLSKA